MASGVLIFRKTSVSYTTVFLDTMARQGSNLKQATEPPALIISICADIPKAGKFFHPNKSIKIKVEKLSSFKKYNEVVLLL